MMKILKNIYCCFNVDVQEKKEEPFFIDYDEISDITWDEEE